jgi:hypothetical protein
MRKTTLVKARTFLRNGRVSLPVKKMFQRIDPDENGLSYAYYEGEWDTIPEVSKLEPHKAGEIFDIAEQIPGNRQYDYLVSYNGYIDIDFPGEYAFLTLNDDGLKLIIDDIVVIDDGGEYGTYRNEGKIFLEQGVHRFNLLALQSHGGYDLELQFIPPGGTVQPIPASMFINVQQPSL